MDLIFQTLTSLYTSNSPAVISSDFSHTSFLPGFQKTGVWGAGLGWGDLLSLSFLGSLGCGCPNRSQGAMVALEHGRDTGTTCGGPSFLLQPTEMFSRKELGKRASKQQWHLFYMGQLHRWEGCLGSSVPLAMSLHSPTQHCHPLASHQWEMGSRERSHKPWRGPFLTYVNVLQLH